MERLEGRTANRWAASGPLCSSLEDDLAIALRPQTSDDGGMEGLAPIVAIVVGFSGVVGAVLWGIAAMTGGAGNDAG